ncbi:urease subunit alpha [Klebsiella pneumoniae]|uniref:Urease subunit alpha n=1 Tax=Klebsiella pneumoniae TaxID=573 RepID=A0A447RQQ7_KLEPN|nr:urease subunit alpha [Klebsiella pneumoniae]
MGVLPLVEQIIAGVAGLKVHEDWGATPNALRHSLRIADEMDIQVSVHTDSLNEAGYVENTIEAFEGRTIHTVSIPRGPAVGTQPDIIKVAAS